ncbi:MAG: 4Fe-4S dicluster domain-containing protein [Ignavibacteria bacterium]|jgi:formate dehydrogenase subunit beta|nr:4Fe-4S dicluster domain-containing protein [Ignavibacteria bacterium]MBK6878692.1 4Fe-4S dicluster domain-containing protein [Ignavibacteria bacterium]
MDELRNYARELLEKEEVAAVIGYQQVTEKRTKPIVITDPAETSRLVFNEYCLNNLAVYLTKARIRSLMRTKDKTMKLAIVAKPCDVHSIVALIQENQIHRNDVHIISFNCHGVVKDFGCDFNGDNLAAKCIKCETHKPLYFDKIFGEEKQTPKAGDASLEKINELEKLNSKERFEFFKSEFDKCIKCYACRAVCPLCYCQRCITDKAIPRWIESSSHQRGNFSWNIVRAFHLSGRCTGCGECDRACPMDIPLSLINRRMAMEVKDLFSFVSGRSLETPTLVGNFDKKDSDEIFM